MHSFVFVAVNIDHPEWGPGVRAHYYRDCPQFAANNCRPEEVPGFNRTPERPLCFSCVGRLVSTVEAGNG